MFDDYLDMQNYNTTMRLKPFIYAMLVVGCGFSSCHKHGGKGGSDSNAMVYVAGYQGIPGFNAAGALWVNGVSATVPNSSGIVSMCLNDTSVYLLNGAPSVYGAATYWNNMVPATIPNAIFTKSIQALNGDVYVVGGTVESSSSGVGSTAAALYFKNGAPVNLTQNLPNVVAAFTNGIAFSGSDVYVCGYLYAGSNDTADAVYWKNGTLTYLPSGYMAKAIAVSGNDVYVAGTPIHGGDVYWKNGAMQPLGPDAAIASCIAVVGNDVYVGGTTLGENKAVYWKNGVEVELPGGYAVNAMAVVGSDVYAAGNNNGGYAVVWKNGVPDTLGIGGASAIVVK